MLPVLLVGCVADTQEEEVPLEVVLSEDPVQQIDNIAQTVGEELEELEELLEVDEDEDDSDTEFAELVDEGAEEVAPTSTLLEEARGLDGAFTYDVSYLTPKGATEMTAAFTVTDNVISDVTLTGNPQHKTSLQYQQTLQAELGSLVIGKDLSSVSALPAKVSGSSLTPGGFNQALAQLQAEA